MKTVKWLTEIMENWAPLSYAESWDNVGLLIGDSNKEIKNVLVALDVTDDVVEEALEGGFDFIISHHPIIYNPISKLVASDPISKKILMLIKHNIGLYSSHTNLDKAAYGVNDVLALKLGLKNISPLIPEESHGEGIGIGRVGNLPEPKTLKNFAEYVKNILGLSEVRYAGDLNTEILTVGLCGGDGSNGSFLKAAAKRNCHVYITGDLRYHMTHEALDLGLNLLDIGHYNSEKIIVETIVNRFKKEGINIKATKTKGKVLKVIQS